MDVTNKSVLVIEVNPAQKAYFEDHLAQGGARSIQTVSTDRFAYSRLLEDRRIDIVVLNGKYLTRAAALETFEKLPS